MFGGYASWINRKVGSVVIGLGNKVVMVVALGALSSGVNLGPDVGQDVIYA